MAKAPRVLFVDDEPQVLNAIRRGLRKDFQVETAAGGAEALTLVESQEPFSVVVSDCRMPEMDGIELLEKIGKLSPESTRIMLTGNTDQETAVRAVNRGDVFKFLNKPCSPEDLRHVLSTAVRQYELVTAEKTILEQTLKSCIAVLAELLSLAQPDVFGRTSRLRREAGRIGDLLDDVRTWELDTATLLSQLGCIGISSEVLGKARSGEPLSDSEAHEVASHPALTADLIGQIPRMDEVARIVLYQNKRYDGGGFPDDGVAGDDLPIESRILSVVLGHDELMEQGMSTSAAARELESQSGRFDPYVLNALSRARALSVQSNIRPLCAADLVPGMIIHEDVRSDSGVMLIRRGQEVTSLLCQHLGKFERSGALTSPIIILERADEAEA